jgi:putative ABC transport system permease protein
MKEIPGVLAAGINVGMPPVFSPNMPVVVPGSAQSENRPALIHLTNEDYLKVMGISVVQGRFVTEQEVNARTHSAAVNQAFVRRYFPDGQAMGRVVRIPVLRTAPLNLADDSVQIVGVVRDTINRVTTRETWPELYMPFTLVNRSDRIFVLGSGSAAMLAKPVKAAVYAADPVQPVMDERSLEAALNEFAYARPRFNVMLFGIFAGLGLALALFGIYGVISHAVSQQTREIGIRIALGAGFSQVTGMVLKFGATVLGVGIVVGLGASLASVKLLKGLVVNVSTFDPISFVAVTALLLTAGIFAALWPARRAARVDPMRALRDE